MLALCNTQRSVALVGQLCTDLDLLAASCQAMEEQARLKLAEVSTFCATDCNCRTVFMHHSQGCCSMPSPMEALPAGTEQLMCLELLSCKLQSSYQQCEAESLGLQHLHGPG